MANTGGGDIVLAAEGAAVTDDLTIAADITASGGDGSVSLFAGDDIAQNSGTISAAGAGTVKLSAGDNHNGGVNQTGNAGGSVTLAGTVTS
ncbi:MAG: hypothetical protein GWN07_41515, partial [Actinobacteria bacterium]|nr:hypothetical protein [Actinomycetota bacterium]NIS37511.1 hypothetical protein [Actinomycetota bacterium]NIU71577.1 hypothetical protein [Actinomycetota bacterium]NIW33527.1 hypothetical protein [Actinomycetota bacterium]NIX25952.1 hypothetical protein [Actinomycetota bacterium]